MRRGKSQITTSPVGLLFDRISLIILAVFLLLAAWAGYTVIVIVLGLVLAAAGICLLWSHLALKGINATRVLNVSRAFPGENLESGIRIVNNKPLPLAWIEVNDHIPENLKETVTTLSGVSQLDVNAQDGQEADEWQNTSTVKHSGTMPAYTALTWKQTLYCRKRGYYRIGPFSYTSGDIFGFLPRTFTASETDQVIVYPRIFPIKAIETKSLFPMGDLRSENLLYEDPLRCAGVRDYRPGDNLRRIHWKSSARQQQLKVKIYEPTTTLKAAILLAADTYQLNGIWDRDSFELGVSTAASICNYLVENKSQAGFWSNAKMADSDQSICVPPGSGVDQTILILEALARVIPACRMPFWQFFSKERSRLTAGTTLIFIMGHANTEESTSMLREIKQAGYRSTVIQTGYNGPIAESPEAEWLHVRERNGELEFSNRDTPE